MTSRGVACQAAGILEQWAVKVIKFSSEYDSCGWSASSTLGPPRVYPRYGDIRGSWAQQRCGRDEFIEILDYKTKAIRLDIDCGVANSWVEIDAVQLVGRELKIEPPPSPLEALTDLRKLVNNEENADVVFMVDEKPVYAHRAILCIRSATSKDMLADTIKVRGTSSYRGSTLFARIFKSRAHVYRYEAVIPIYYMDHKTFLGILHHVYCGSIPDDFSPASLVSVWEAAQRIKINGLQAYCVSSINRRINSDNVIDIYAKASEIKPRADDIREVCLEFMVSNLATVCRTEQFKELSQPLLVEIVQLSTARLAMD